VFCVFLYVYVLTIECKFQTHLELYSLRNFFEIKRKWKCKQSISQVLNLAWDFWYNAAAVVINLLGPCAEGDLGEANTAATNGIGHPL
jgi:hypothetical protein